MLDSRGNYYLILGEPGVGVTPGFVLAQLLETGETIQLNASYVRKPNNIK